MFSCPRSATSIHSVPMNRTPNFPIVRLSLYHWANADPAIYSPPMPRCQVMLWCAVGALLKNQPQEKKDWASLDYLPWFHAKPFLSDFERRGNTYQRRTTGALMFASLPSNVISFLCSKDFWLGLLCLARKAAQDLGAPRVRAQGPPQTRYPTMFMCLAICTTCACHLSLF